MSKKDDTIKALKKKLKKLKAEVATLKAGGRIKDEPAQISAKPTKDKPTKHKPAKGKDAKRAKRLKAESEKGRKAEKVKKTKAKAADGKKNATAKTAAPPAGAQPEPMKIVAKEPTPLLPPARAIAG